MGKLEIAIAGCGPGGLAAALLLHRAGHRVALFDRFEQPRPLGSGLILQPTGLAVLEMLDLAANALKAGARIDRLFGRVVPSGRIILDVRYSALPSPAFGIGIHRGALFHLLYDQVLAEKVPIGTSREIVGTEMLSGGRRSLCFADGRSEGPFDLIVDALGTQSALVPDRRQPLAYGALWTTLDWREEFDANALEQRYRRASKMVGVLPVGRIPGDPCRKAAFFWSLGGDEYSLWLSGGLDRWKEEVLGLWPETASLLGQIEDLGQMTFARYCHRTLARPVETGLVHLGDAWHSTSPQLGQGANMALLDAAALARAIEQASDLPTALAAYATMRSAHIRTYQALSYLFTPFYQSESRLLPLVRDYLAGPLSRVPPAPRLLASLVSGSVGAPLRRIGGIRAESLPFRPLPPKALDA